MISRRLRLTISFPSFFPLLAPLLLSPRPSPTISISFDGSLTTARGCSRATTQSTATTPRTRGGGCTWNLPSFPQHPLLSTAHPPFHNFPHRYAMLMLLAYPVGIPLLYLEVILRHNRNQLRIVEQVCSSPRSRSLSVHGPPRPLLLSPSTTFVGLRPSPSSALASPSLTFDNLCRPDSSRSSSRSPPTAGFSPRAPSPRNKRRRSAARASSRAHASSPTSSSPSTTSTLPQPVPHSPFPTPRSP